MKLELTDYIRNIPDFPKPGIQFKDITPLLQDHRATEKALNELLASIKNTRIDKVVGVEARGFLFGTLLAQKLQAGFIPIRKPGKLPYKTSKISYTLEYGTDALEMHEDAISPGDHVLLHDDLLATGGTASAAKQLIEQNGGKIVHCSFLVELDFLKGREKLAPLSVHSLLHY